MVAAPSPPADLALSLGQAIEDVREALPLNRSLMRSVALASLVPFFLLTQGHYFPLSLVLMDYFFVTRDTYRFVGDGRYIWLPGDERADALVGTVFGIAAFSFVLLCSSMVATVYSSAAINSGRRLTLAVSFSKMGGLWREQYSPARLYFTILLLGYLLSVVAVVLVSLVIAGDSIRLGDWRLLISLSALFSFLYLGVLRSVGRLGTFLQPEEGRRGMELASWRTAVDLVTDGKLQGFCMFFLSLLITHGFFQMGGQRICWGGCYEVGMKAFQLCPFPLVLSILWMLGSCGLFGYVGVLLQV